MHKTLKGFVVGAATVFAVTSIVSTAHASKCGDLNNDGSVQINDVILHLNAVNGSPASICGGAGYANCANLDGKGPIPADTNDLILELNKASGIVNCKPDQCIAETVLACAGPTTIPAVGTGVNLFVPKTCDARLANGLTFVQSGGILNIERGTTIKATTGNPVAALVVKPGGRINSTGTVAEPIVFTSAGGPPAAGDWGGVNLLGKAPVNQPGITLEGLPPDPSLVYGGTDGNDFSGCVQYTRINYGGRELSPDNELNNFTMAGVGRKTIINHVQAHRGFDDNFEWFGGTVNTSFLVASACGDDCFDTQLGTVGGVQFGLGMQEAEALETPGSQGFENDNSEFGPNNAPINNPKYCNITMLGAKYSAANPGTTNQVGILSRRGNAITIANSIVKDFRQAGYQLRDPETAVHACTSPAALNTTPPIGQIVNSLFNNNGSGGSVHANDGAGCASGGPCTCSSPEHFALLVASKNVLGTGDASIAAIGGASFPRTNLVPPGGSLAATHPAADCTLINSSFVAAPYIGAFQPGGADWTAGWTAYP